ncbi:MAG: hypothetical protein HFG15_04955 [Bacilli bacterium]|nr:hypothetical protein [Bacilli bacterium]
MKSNNIMNKKVKWLLFLIILFIFLGLFHYVLLPRLTDYSISHLINKDMSAYDGMFLVKNSKVYGLNTKKTDYNNLISYNGIGSGYIQLYNNKKYSYGLSVGILCITRDIKGNKKINLGRCQRKMYTFSFTGKEQVFIAPKTGTYKIELWGAGGGNAHALGVLFDQGGSGAYVAGEIKLQKNDVLYLQVGSRGGDGTIIEDMNRLTAFSYPSVGGSAGYNGGGKGFDDPQTDAGGGGGGATDIRLTSGNWDDFESLKSRIMVAGGGGGSSRYYSVKSAIHQRGKAGAGGTIHGEDAAKLLEAHPLNGHGATQTDGYQFGIGENGEYCMTSLNGAGGGAGGYFGSRTGACGIKLFEMPTGAGGGSSYVSGCDRCKAIEKKSSSDQVLFTDQPIHYSKKKFTNIVMKSGSQKMPNPFGGTMTGNRNDGYARITFIK